MKTNNIWANKFKPTNQFEQYNELRQERNNVENAQVLLMFALVFVAGAMVGYLFGFGG